MLDVMAAGAALTGIVALAGGGAVASPQAAPSTRTSEVGAPAPAPVKLSLVAAVSAARQELAAQPGDADPVPPPPVSSGVNNQPGTNQPVTQPAGNQPVKTNPVGLHRSGLVVHRSGVVHSSSFGQRSSSSAIHGQRVIMIIRHGEKPGKGGGHGLTAAGWARAQGLASVFGSGRNGMATPRAIFAAGATSQGRGQRTRETVSPLARRLGLGVNTTFGKGQEAALARAAAAKSQNGPVLIAWQHGEIPAIAKALKVAGKMPKGWSKGNYDGVWKFTWTPHGWVFSQGSEGLSGGKHGKH